MVRLRVRIRFCKQDELRLIGHRDLMRCFERLFRRASVPLGMSQGFHPKPRMTFPLPLAVGIEGADEVMELELAESLSAEDLLARLKSQAPRGLLPLSAEILAPGAKKARACGASYEAPIPPPLDVGLDRRINRLLAQSTCTITRPHGRAPVDLRPMLEELSFRRGVLLMRLKIAQEGGVGPRDVLAALGLEDLESRGVRLTRTAVELGP
ncbi:MAG: TIGR03936 family radical SAM-associated protein [Thermoguttaceae bacterium]|jgi:radical SAM-linked protein